MAYSRNNRNSYRTVYVNDNLARKQEAYIETTSPRKRETVTQQPQKQDLHKAHSKANHGLSSSFGFAFTLVMAGVMVGIFIVLTKYISLNINMTQKAREIASLRKELSTMTMENDNLEISINSSIDYDYIYKVATEELGMVYPSCSQIIRYDSEDSEYVVQYKDVE